MSYVIPYRFVLLAILLVLPVLWSQTMGIEAVAGGKRLGQDGPPLHYKLHDIAISVVKHPGNPAFGSRTVQLAGDGTCRVTTTKPSFSQEPDDSQDDRCPTVSTEDLMAVLNEFYRVHFFNLQSSYTSQHSVVLLEDGKVLTQALKLADTGSTVLCVKIGDYEKCVTMVKDVPKELEALTQKIVDFGQPSLQ